MNRRVYFIALLTIAAAALTWFFQSRQIERGKALIAGERLHASRLEQQLAEFQREEAQRATAIKAVAVPSSTTATGDGAADFEGIDAAREQTWLAQAKRLRQSFADDPTQSIPELKLLNDLDWLTVARTIVDDSALGLRKARSATRTLAIKRFARPLGAALREYTSAHNGNLPEEVTLLLPYFAPPIDPDLLHRYTMTAAGNIRTLRREVIAERSPVDEEFDPRTSISASGGVMSNDSWALAIFQNAAFQSGDEFSLANGGEKSKTADDLLPYVNDPVLRPIFAAIATFRKSQSQFTYRFADLRSYVTDPAASAFLEKLIVAEQKRNPP
jgi:hypothetical protein